MSSKTKKMEIGRSNRPGRSAARQNATHHSPQVSSLLRAGRDGLQAKLRINPPGDVYEQEADRVAAQVMRMSDTRPSPAADYQRLKDRTAHAGAVQRVCASCAEDETLIQAKSAGCPGREAPATTMTGIQSLQGGQPLSESQRTFFEPRIGADFSQVRIHHGRQAAGFANSINARAFTLSNNVVFGAGEYSPESASGKKLLAHELTHVVQQNGGASDSLALTLPRTEPAIQRDMTDPGRLTGVHGDVMVQGPPRRTGGGGSAARRAWVDPTPGNGGTADLLFNQTYAFLNARTFNRNGPVNTTDANLDADAVAMHQRVVERFPQISTRLSDTEIQNRVGLLEPATIRNDRDYLNQWMDNFIDQMSDSEEYDIDLNNAAYRSMINRLIDDPDVGSKIVQLAANTSAFTRGEGAGREVFVHRKVEESERRLTLIHEITHFYRDQRYADWVAATKDKRHYNEGLTEWLARKVMTASERSSRQSYQERVDTIDSQISPNISEDGIARAYFAGEVWRLESRSAESRAAFEADTGIREGSTHQDEGMASRAGAGLFQTVTAGSYYRFINLGRDQAQPKPEHEAAFRNVKSSQLDTTPSKKVRFVGHASGPGADSHNLALSLRRSVAFYRMARREGLPSGRMVDENHPPHVGESHPSVTEEDAVTRSMNRRVEMFLIS